MNFAEAIRQAAAQHRAPQAAVASEAITEPRNTEAAASDQPETEVHYFVTESHSGTDTEVQEDATMNTTTQGNVVRLELFLTPEQLTSLFRAISATQHSMMTTREAASYLRIAGNHLEQMAKDGEIQAFLIDGKWRFTRNGIDAWLSTQNFKKESA